MNDYLLELIKKYKHKGLLIDTNIVLLYIIGSIDISMIRNFSRTSMFTENDFDRVSKFIDYFTVKITTPHILTEVSNLLGNKEIHYLYLRTYLENSNEIFLKSAEISINKSFLSFGLTDAAVIETGKDLYLIFTNDRPLYGYLNRNNIDAVNLELLSDALN